MTTHLRRLTHRAIYDGRRGRSRIDANVLFALVLGATALFVVATWLRQVPARRIFVRGAVIALAAAAVIGVIVFVAAAFLPGGTFPQALYVAGVVSGGFLWLNLIVLSIGLWFKPSDSWSLGAMLSTPVILAAIGFGYVAYRAWPLQ